MLKDLDSGLVVCVGLTPANVPEAWVTDAIASDLKAQNLTLSELHIDRAYLTSQGKRIKIEGQTMLDPAIGAG